MGNVILLRLGKQQWRDANLRKISTEMGHDCFMFRKLLCDPAVLVLEMQGHSDKFPLLIMDFLLTSSLQFPLCFQPNQFFPVIGSSVNTGDSCPLQEKLQGEGRNEPLERAWQWLRRSLARGLCCTAVLCPRAPVAHKAGSCTSPAMPSLPAPAFVPSHPCSGGGGLS